MPEEYYDEDGFRLSFENDTDPEEKQYYMRTFPNVSKIVERKIHCTSCQTHIGTAPMSVAIIRMHPVLRVTHCRSCHAFYNSGEFDKGEDGSELYCRWCGQGGEVYCCSNCPYVFCKSCILKNLSRSCVQDIARNENWNCFGCAPKIMWHLRAQHWALMNFIEKQKKDIKMQHDPQSIDLLLKQDLTTCCAGKGTPRAKGNQTPSGSGSKKHSKRPGEQDEAGNVPLAKIRNVGSGDSGMKKDKSLKPMVTIPPIPPTLLGKEENASPSSTPTTKAQKRQKHNHPSKPVDSQEQSHSPSSPKKAKKGNNEVVCTPDIMSIFNQMDEARTMPATTSKQSNVSPGVIAIGAPNNMPDNLNAGPSSSKPMSPLQVSIGTQKPKAILHKSLPRNLMVRLGPAEATPSASIVQANQVAESAPPTVRVPASTSSSRQFNISPVYTTFNGYRIDLHSAAQQGTFRLPNGKLIQVRKTSDAAASTVSSPQITPDVAYGAPEVAPAGANPHIMEQRANRTPLALNSQTNIPGLVIRPTASQVYTPLLQQPPPSTPTFPIVQPTLSYIPQQHQQQHQQMQHQLQQQSLQHVQPPSMQQQHLQQQQQQQNQQQQQQHQQQQQQQQEQQHQQQQQQQEQQQQQPRQQLQQHIIQRQRSRPAQRSKSHKQPQRQQQLFQRILPYPQPPRPIPGIVSTGGQLATHAFAQRPNEEQMVQQSPHPPAASSPIQLPILHMLRGLVNAPHENTSLGSARKDFEEKLLGCVEACNHIIIKIHSLTQSNSFKSIRNTRDVKELFIHLSYLLTYGKGRFNTLHDRCVEDVKKMGFTKPSDFVMMGENVNNRNPEDSEDDDDCEIVEQNTTVIQVDSDDEGGAAEGSAAARRAKPPNDSTMPSNGGSNLPDSTSSGQQSMPNDSTVSSVLNKSAEERTDDSGMPSPAACSSKDSVADSRQTESAEPLQASTLDAEKQDKSNKESVENNPEDDRMEVSASNKQEVGLEKDTLEPAKENKTTEPMESLATEGESIAKSEETQPVANLEKETNEPAKETEASLEKETNVLAKENEIIDLMEPSDSEGESFTKSIEPQTEESSEKETNELAKEDDIIDLMEPSDSEGESITKSDEPTTEMKPTSDSEGESITKSDEPTTEASSEKETNDPAKANETTEPIESLESEGENQTKSDQTSTEAEKEALDPAKMNEITAPMESFDSEGGDHIKFHQTSSEVGLKTLTVASCISNDNTEKDASISKEELRNNSDVVVLKPTEQSTIPDGNDVSLGATLEPMEVSESQGEHPDNFNEVSLKDGMETHSTEDALGTGLDAELIEMSTTDRDQLDNVLSNTCLKKRVNEDSNTSTLGSWESIENLVEDVDGGHVKKCEAQTANTTEKCTKSDEPTQPADVIPQEKNGDKIMVLEETMSEKVKEKNVKEDIQTKESTNTSPSSSKLIENENSNEEAGQDDFCKEDTDNSFHGGSNSPMVEGESNDKDLAVALDNSLNQSSILLNAISKTSETQEGSPEQNASINEEEQLSDKEKESDSAKDTTEDELEEVSKGGGSDCGVINLMDASNDTDLDEDRSEVDCFDVESKIPERDSQQAAIICLDDTVEQSVSGSSTAPKDSLHDILLDDLSSISSSSNDEYADAINKKDSTSHAKTIDAEAGQSTSSVVTDDKTSSASQAQTVSSSTLERPIEEPATIATDRALPSRTSFDQQREP